MIERTRVKTRQNKNYSSTTETWPATRATDNNIMAQTCPQSAENVIWPEIVGLQATQPANDGRNLRLSIDHDDPFTDSNAQIDGKDEEVFDGCKTERSSQYKPEFDRIVRVNDPLVPLLLWLWWNNCCGMCQCFCYVKHRIILITTKRSTDFKNIKGY